MLGRWNILLQLATTLPLAGLIWLIQVVSYPLFEHVSADAFPRYHEAHARLITFVVGPLMVVELLATCAMLIDRPAAMPRTMALVGVVLVGIAWAVTILVSVPQHAILARGFNAQAYHILVTSNWLRTLAWSVRSLGLLWLAARSFKLG